jgi:hypothetical protein
VFEKGVEMTDSHRKNERKAAVTEILLVILSKIYRSFYEYFD